jgi:hypothetical protein
LTLGVPIWIFSQALVSCGSDDDEGTACEPNVLRACSGAGQCEGLQTCAADGSGYSECACEGSGSAGTAGAGGSGTGGSANAGGGAAGAGAGVVDSVFDPLIRPIGAPCSTDADCPTAPDGDAPLFCITPTSTEEFDTGSPQGGYCSARCSASEECQALDELSVCGFLDESGANGFCIGVCITGDSNLKCLPGTETSETTARAQACFPIPGQQEVGACLPVCQSDAACGEGLFCDLGATGLGVCTATAPVGGDIGAPCTEETQAADCRSGLCVTLRDAAGNDAGSFCTANCTFGLIEGCGFDQPSSVPRDAACLQSQLDVNGPGDIGFCFELCDADADCEQEGWVCGAMPAALQTAFGRVGECGPPEPGAAPAVDAGAD